MMDTLSKKILVMILRLVMIIAFNQIYQLESKIYTDKQKATIDEARHLLSTVDEELR